MPLIIIPKRAKKVDFVKVDKRERDKKGESITFTHCPFCNINKSFLNDRGTEQAEAYAMTHALMHANQTSRLSAS